MDTDPDKVLSRKRVLVILLFVAVVAFFAGGFLLSDDMSYSSDEYSRSDSCNAMIITVYGGMTTYMPERPHEYWDDTVSSEGVMDAIDIAKTDKDIKAVLLYIDSPGGEPVAGEEIAHAMKSLDLPTVAVIRGMGASAAYWAATGADKIYASRISDVGSIAITASYLDDSRKIEREGYNFNELSTGRFKNLGNSNKVLTLEERNILMSDLRKMHDVFVQDVAENRGLAVSEVEKLANGLTYVGVDALRLGLIDEIGGLDTATKYLEALLDEEVEYCWY